MQIVIMRAGLLLRREGFPFGNMHNSGAFFGLLLRAQWGLGSGFLLGAHKAVETTFAPA